MVAYTFQQAMGQIQVFNKNEARTRCESAAFFNFAALLMGKVGGRRLSGVLTTDNHQIMVFERKTDAKKPRRVLAIYYNGRGRILRAHELVKGFEGFLTMEFLTAPEPLPAMGDAPAVAAAAEVASPRLVSKQPELHELAGQPLPACTDIRLPNSLLPQVFRKLVPDLQRRADMLMFAEEAACRPTQRRPAYHTPTEGLELLGTERFPLDTLHLLEAHLEPALAKFGLTTLPEALEKPKALGL